MLYVLTLLFKPFEELAKQFKEMIEPTRTR